jgi:hypothetical protein
MTKTNKYTGLKFSPKILDDLTRREFQTKERT